MNQVTASAEVPFIVLDDVLYKRRSSKYTYF